VNNYAIIAHGKSALVALARQAGLLNGDDLMRVQTCNMSAEEIAERDRPKSRQERRAEARRAMKRKEAGDV
jgi:hypothetical protein